MYKIFRTAGLSKAGASALIGNTYAESSCNPLTNNKIAYGLVQWEKSNNRYMRLIKMANYDTIETQASFMVQELKERKASNGESLYSFLCHVKSPGDACSEVAWKYEVCAWADTPSTHTGPDASFAAYHGNLSRNLVTHGLEFYDSHSPSTIGKKIKRFQANYDTHRGNWVIAYYKRYYMSYYYYNKYKGMSDKEIQKEAEGAVTGAGETLPDVPGADAYVTKALSWAFNHTQATAGWKYSQGMRNQNGYADCSSFVRRAYNAAGIDFSSFESGPTRHCSNNMYLNFKKAGCVVPMSQIKPGDLVFAGSGEHSIGHVEMYVKGNTTIGAHTSKSATNQIGFSTLGNRFRYCVRPSKLVGKKKKRKRKLLYCLYLAVLPVF